MKICVIDLSNYKGEKASWVNEVEKCSGRFRSSSKRARRIRLQSGARLRGNRMNDVTALGPGV